MVLNVTRNRNWDVKVGGRIEQVTDQESFPELFSEALNRASGINVIAFNQPKWPHTTSIVVRIVAGRREEAEARVRELVLPAYLNVAQALLGTRPFGWTLSLDATPVLNVGSRYRKWRRLPRYFVRHRTNRGDDNRFPK